MTTPLILIDKVARDFSNNVVKGRGWRFSWLSGGFRAQKIYNGVKYTYDRTDCTGNCDQYCRCKKIIDTKIISIDIASISKELIGESDDVIGSYCVDRLIRMSDLKEHSSWEVSVDWGYYGEQCLGVKPSDVVCDQLLSDFNKLAELETEIDAVKFILKAEYGYILPDLEAMEHVELIEASLDSVELYNDQYMRKLNKKHVDQYNEYDLPRAICISSGNKYRVIDGFHRITSANNQSLDTVKIWLMS